MKSRYPYNMTILEILKKHFEANKHERFLQALINLNVVPASDSALFYKESHDTLAELALKAEEAGDL